MAPAGDKGGRIYNAALNKLGGLGQIISVEDSTGVWAYRRIHSAHQHIYQNEICFKPNFQRPVEKYNESFILKKFDSPRGSLNIEFFQDDIMDKNLFFSGYSLYCCVRNTIFSAAPVAAIKNQPQTFTLLKEYLWAEVIVNNYMYNQALKIPDSYFRFYNQYLGTPAWLDFKKSLREYYAFPAMLEERDLVNKVYNYYGINLFFHYAGKECPLYTSRQNKLRIDLVLR
ncbi:MAG: hypothetical protein LBD62_00295 [Candidatus Margulisbacteria bacterium]|nr:hypothetical protein [Candidatus Margulisiibacteriota bacterium]